MDSLVKDIELDHILSKSEYVVVGVSTGIDSMSLFYYLNHEGYKVVVAHVNHKRRLQSEDEYVFLEGLCARLGVPFEGYELTKPIEGNFQETARNERYAFFKRVADKYHTTKIAVAHQLDDEAETVVMRLIRGTSLRGYRGINIITTDGKYSIFRPLLHTSRAEIEEYVKENRIPFFEDQTNAENHYTRNIVRHKIIPIMKEVNPSFLSSILNYESDMDNVYHLVEDLTKEFYKTFVKIDKNNVFIDEDALNKTSDAIRNHVILKAINYITNNTVIATHERIREIAKLSLSLDTGKMVEIKDNYVVFSEYGRLVFTTTKSSIKVSLILTEVKEYEVSGYGKIILSHNYHCLPDKKSYLLCYNEGQMVFPIRVRNKKDGDTMVVNGITKKVSDILKDEKVPRRLRDRVLVFENQDGIFFIPGIMRKETDTSKTNKLYITFEDGDHDDNGSRY